MPLRKKSHTLTDLNLNPILDLFSILVPFLLSVAAFQKMALVDVNLPEQSEVSVSADTGPVDDAGLNLTIALKKDGIAVWAKGGELPTVFVKEMVTVRCKATNDTMTVDWETLSAQKKLPKCSDGHIPEEKEKDVIHLWALEKTSESDPGRLRTVVRNPEDSAYMTVDGKFIEKISDMKVGEFYTTLGGKPRVLTESQMKFVKSGYLSGYEVLKHHLSNIQESYKGKVPDIESITVLASDDIIYDKIINAMDAARDAGFFRISLAKLTNG